MTTRDDSAPAAKAPVAVFAFNRPALLRRTLQCLRDAGARQLHIFSDGPRVPADTASVLDVRAVIHDIDWADELTIVERESNVGLSGSIRSGLDQVFSAHSAAVVVEDDVCISPEFLRYVSHCLDYYRHEPRVASITGLRYPFRFRTASRFHAFLSPRFSSWGWATWRRYWLSLTFERETLEQWYYHLAPEERHRAGADWPPMIDSYLAGATTDAWDLAIAINHLHQGMVSVWPMWNMVRNIGFESGTHFTSAPAWNLEWEEPPSRDEWHLPPPGFVDEQANARLKQFLARHYGTSLRRRIERRIDRFKQRWSQSNPP